MQESLSDDQPVETSEGGPDPVDRHVGLRVQLRRDELGLSQKDLGQALGVTYQQIQKYEKALNRISVSALMKLAQTLNKSVDWFFEGAPGLAGSRIGFSDNGQAGLEGMPSGSADLDPKLLRNKETQKLLKAYYSIANEKKRQNLLKLIQDMADGGA